MVDLSLVVLGLAFLAITVLAFLVFRGGFMCFVVVLLGAGALRLMALCLTALAGMLLGRRRQGRRTMRAHDLTAG